MEEVSDVVHPGASRGVRAVAWVGLVLIVGSLLGILVGLFFQDDDDLGAPGALEEDNVVRPADLVIPPVTDATSDWGLDDWRTTGAHPLRGGVTLHDLDRDGDLDLAVAGQRLGLYRWDDTRYRRVEAPDVGDAISVHAGDVDGDGFVDLLVGRSDGAAIVWGSDGLLVDARRDPEVTDLEVDGRSTGAVPVELGSGRAAVLVLGYGGDRPISDVLLVFEGRAVGDRIVLPDSARRSAAVAVADFDGDSLADMWVARDQGWSSGGDSVYSRRGDPEGEWVDIAAGLGAALEVDAAGMTVADWDGDGSLDAYVSDLGDNELLAGTGSGFEPRRNVGAAHIRSLGADDNQVSRSWASGAVDWNLDGALDLVVVNGGFSELTVRNKIVNTFIQEDEAPAVLLQTSDGRFYDAWADSGLEWVGRSRGLAVGDVDADGDVDLVVADHEGGLHALRNDLSSAGVGLDRAPTCLHDGALVMTDGYGVLHHQLSFLGAHAPGVVVADGGGVEIPVCSPAAG